MSKTSKNLQISNRNLWLVGIIIAAMLLIVGLVASGYITFAPKSKPLAAYTIAKVTYNDGTTKTFSQSQSMLYSPLTILDPNNGNKTVTNVEFDLYAQPTYTGTTTSQTFSFAWNWLYCVAESSNPSLPNLNSPIYTSPTNNLTAYPISTPLVSGISQKLLGFTIAASSLQGIYTSWLPNVNYFCVIEFQTPLSITMTFSDGTSQTLSTTVLWPYWEFNYISTNSFTSLSISWQKAMT